MDWPHFGRVTLKPFAAGLSEEEWKALWEIFKDPEVAYWNGSAPLRSPLWLFKRLVQMDLRRKDRLAFGVLNEKGEWIGTVELYDLTPEEGTLGILLHRSWWGKGYGTEAVKALLGYGFGVLGLSRVRLRTFLCNERAQRAFKKAGFKEVGRLRSRVVMEVKREAFSPEARGFFN
ncbi:MAG: GNAT family N-acetyltransferase [Thermaceae bacterium]